MKSKQFSERFVLEKRHNEYSDTYYYKLKDIVTNKYCYFTLGNKQSTLKEVAKAYNNGRFKPYNIPTREQTKVMDIFDHKPTINRCRELLKELFPPTKYFKGHRYNNLIKSVARVIATNVVLKRIHGTLRNNSTIFRTHEHPILDRDELLTIYRELFGDVRLNVEGECIVC